MQVGPGNLKRVHQVPQVVGPVLQCISGWRWAALAGAHNIEVHHAKVADQHRRDPGEVSQTQGAAWKLD